MGEGGGWELINAFSSFPFTTAWKFFSDTHSACLGLSERPLHILTDYFPCSGRQTVLYPKCFYALDEVSYPAGSCFLLPLQSLSLREDTWGPSSLLRKEIESFHILARGWSDAHLPPTWTPTLTVLGNACPQLKRNQRKGFSPLFSALLKEGIDKELRKAPWGTILPYPDKIMRLKDLFCI